MAFASTTAWDVRTTGNDANGGGFDTAASGTDFSQQNSAQIAFTDLVIGATTTQITSVAHPFDSTSPGNIINITGGTGFTVQRVQIVSQAAGVATCDKSVGTAASTGGTGNLGGSLATVDKVSKNTAIMVSGNTVYIKAGTYTLTSTWIIDTSASTSGALFFVGYQTTHNDGGTKPLITTSTNSVKLIQTVVTPVSFTNLSLSNTAGTRADGIWFSSTCNPGIELINCILDGFVVGLNGDNGVGGAAGFSLQGCEIKNCSSDGVRTFFPTPVEGCYIHNNGGNGIATFNSAATLCLSNSIFANNGARGVGLDNANQFAFISNCVFSGNTTSGLGSGLSAHVKLVNNIFYGNGTYGIQISNGLTSGDWCVQANNAFGNNTTANRSVTTNPDLFGDITLTASPFTNSGAGDYSLNSTAGGGSACKAAGFPGVFPGGLSTGSLDVGAVQSGGGGGSTGMLYIPSLDGV